MSYSSTGMTYEEYFEHYGVKGMKWGVRRKSGSESTGPRKPLLSDKQKSIAKKVLVGAAAVGVAAAVGTYAYKTGKAGAPKKSGFYDTSMSDLVSDMKKQVPLTTKKPSIVKRKARKQQAERFNNETTFSISVKDLNKLTKPLSPRAQAKLDKKAAKAKASEGTRYRNIAQKTDSKLYGEKGKARIEKRLKKGTSLSEARKKEAQRQGAEFATKVAVNLARARLDI